MGRSRRGAGADASVKVVAATRRGRVCRPSPRKAAAVADAEGTAAHMRSLAGGRVRFKNAPLRFCVQKRRATRAEPIDAGPPKARPGDDGEGGQPFAWRAEGKRPGADDVDAGSVCDKADDDEDDAAGEARDVVLGAWSKEEDEWLAEAVARVPREAVTGKIRWSVVATYVPNRNGKQCRERWHNHIDPDVNKSGWTKREDFEIVARYRAWGPKWAAIAAALGTHRTDNQVKNQFNCSLMRRAKDRIRAQRLGIQVREAEDNGVAALARHLVAEGYQGGVRRGAAKPRAKPKRKRPPKKPSEDAALEDVERLMGGLDSVESLLDDEMRLQLRPDDDGSGQGEVPGDVPTSEAPVALETNETLRDDHNNRDDNDDDAMTMVVEQGANGLRRNGWYHFRIYQTAVAAYAPIDHSLFEELNQTLAAAARSC